MSEKSPSTMREATLSSSLWALARSDSKWFGRYIVALIVEALIVMCIVVTVFTDVLPSEFRLTYFVVAPALVALGIYAGMSPGYFIARKSIAAIHSIAPELEVWSLSPFPLNVDTIRRWARQPSPRASLVRPTYAAFGVAEMSIWIKQGMSVFEVLEVPRAPITLVRVIQNGTRPVINLSAPVGQENQMVLVATKGAFSWSPSYLMKGAQYIENWIQHR